MRRFVIAASLLGLVACGGEPLPEESVPGAQAAPAEVEAQATCSNSWECYCEQFKTQETCQAATWKPCFWYLNRCQPTYE